jgi:ubiquitin C-terminal hydrolase
MTFKKKIGALCSRFQDFNQQDSREFLGYLLDGMHEELKFPTENTTNFDEILIKQTETFQVNI